MGKKPTTILGIDIGGSGIKGAPVNVRNGTLLTERHRIPTPQPATPKAVAEAVAQIHAELGIGGPIGCTVPGRVRNGKVETAANIDDAWIGTNAAKLFKKHCGVPVAVLNDADAAGIAEVKFGAGKGKKGTVLLLTFGTGIGSALFVDGTLVPNTEFGHIRYDAHHVAEEYAADSVRSQEHLTWERWAKRRVRPVLAMYEFLLSPDLIIIGGGVSKPEKWEVFSSYLKTKAKLKPAQLGNEAGIVGAALAARALAAS